jgi:regulator of replication initiation timing
MTQATENDRLDRIETKLDKLTDRVEDLTTHVDKLTTDVEKLTTDNEKFSDRFGSYQQATQWVVQLAFTLIASATITVIITSVLRK